MLRRMNWRRMGVGGIIWGKRGLRVGMRRCLSSRVLSSSGRYASWPLSKPKSSVSVERFENLNLVPSGTWISVLPRHFKGWNAELLSFVPPDRRRDSLIKIKKLAGKLDSSVSLIFSKGLELYCQATYLFCFRLWALCYFRKIL